MAVVPFDKKAHLARRRELGQKVRGHGLTLDKELRIKSIYGISGWEYNRKIKAQGNKCACCGGPFDMTAKRPIHIDHDHETGATRGLLCHGCNLMLGHAKDSEETLRRAIRYLRKWRHKCRP